MELIIGLAEYFVFYNSERAHQSLGNLTPDAVYATASGGGGARIIDKFSKSEKLLDEHPNEAASCSCV